MAWQQRAADAAWVAAATAVAMAIVVGAVLRVADPLANPVLAAEDPYTHIVLVQEHLRDGSIDPRNTGGTLYPPGLHAVLAAWWVFGGGSLYDLMRFAGPVFGVAGIALVGLLLARREGPLAAAAGALAVALMPEHIFRSDLTAPTAMDLVLLPFLLLAFAEVLRGKLAWLAAVIPVTAFLALAHPWLMGLVAAAGLVFALLGVVLPWSAARGPPLDARGTPLTVAVIGGGLMLAVASRGDSSDPAFQPAAAALHLTDPGLLFGTMLLVTSALALGLWLRLRRRTGEASPPSKPRRRALVQGVVGLGLVAAMLVPMAAFRGLPSFVDVPRMVGWPVLALAAVALALLPRMGSPIGHLSASLLFAGLPFAVNDPLDTGFLPHRTVVYLGIAAALLAGVAAQRIAELVARGLARTAMRGETLAKFRSRRSKRPAAPVRPAPAAVVLARGGRAVAPLAPPVPRPAPPAVPPVRLASTAPARSARALVGAVAVAALLLVSVAAATPPPYPGGWYRYHTACQFDALKGLGERVDEAPHALVITSSWQSQMVVQAFADNASRVWFFPGFFDRSFDRAGLLHALAGQHPQVYVVSDAHLAGQPGATPEFLAAPPFRAIGAPCPTTTPTEIPLSIHEAEMR